MTAKDLILGIIGTHQHRRRHRLRHRVSRRGDRGALDGRADDRVQHVDRGGGARRDDRGGRQDRRVSARAALRRDRRGLRSGGRALAQISHRRRRTLRPQRHVRRGGVCAAGDLGHQSRDGDRGHRQGARSREPQERGGARRRSSARSNTWDCSRAWRSRTSRIDRVFIGSCTNSRLERSAARRPTSCNGRKVAKSVQRDGGAGIAAGQGRSRKARASTEFSPRPVSSGANPDAACAWG